jgi:hypothetical protein
VEFREKAPVMNGIPNMPKIEKEEYSNTSSESSKSSKSSSESKGEEEKNPSLSNEALLKNMKMEIHKK